MKADAKAAALEALAAEKKSAEAKMSQEGEEGRATTDRSHDMANSPKKKARKEGHKLAEDPKKARAREFTKKAREKEQQAEEAGGTQENQHDDMGAEEERDERDDPRRSCVRPVRRIDAAIRGTASATVRLTAKPMRR